MKPRRDRSGAFMRPMASDVRSETFGCTVIRNPPIERAACASRITPRCGYYCIAAIIGGGPPGADQDVRRGGAPRNLRNCNVCGESSAALPQDEHEVAGNRWPIGGRDECGGGAWAGCRNFFALDPGGGWRF